MSTTGASSAFAHEAILDRTFLELAALLDSWRSGVTSIIRAGRIIHHVPTGRRWLQAKALKARLDPLLPAWSLDYCWLKGRRISDAEALIQPGWQTCDVMSFFGSIPQHRLWSVMRKYNDHALIADLQRFFADPNIECEEGIPEGCSFSPTLANLYLAALDKRWATTAVRCGDNIACADSGRMSADLADIGLRTTTTLHFIHPSTCAAEGWRRE